MFLGHFAMGFGAKAIGRRASLGLLMFSALAADLLFPILLVLGIERMSISPGITAVSAFDLQYFPYSHSLASTIIMASVFGGGYYLAKRDRAGALAIMLATASHWVLDAISHRPDMPIAPGLDLLVGLGLWNSVPGTIVFEGGLFVLSVWAYTRIMPPKDRQGSYALWGLVGVLVLIYAGSILGPPPPADPKAIAWASGLNWLLFYWAWWFDRRRQS